MKNVFVLMLSLVLIGCTQLDKTSKNQALLDLEVSPADAVVVIYNHGTRNPRVKERCQASYNRVPDSLKKLQNDRFIVYFLCSNATEGADRSQAGNQVYARMYEIEQLLNQLIEQGIKPEHIFLSGHSKGAWASLMLMDKVKSKFNAAILFAPALANRASRQSHPWWRNDVRPKQIEQMLQAKTIDALIFAYDDDDYNRPQDLRFLTEKYPNTVRLIGYRCDYEYTHFTHLYDCKSNETAAMISDYVNEQIINWNR